jgi:hypothetical protein
VKFPVPKPHTLTFSDDNSDSGEDLERTVLIANRHLEQVVPPSSEPRLLTQEDVNDRIRDLIPCLKKQVDLLGSRLSWWNLLHQIPEMYLSQSPKSIQRIVLTRKRYGIFNDVCSVIEAVRHQ